MGFPMARHPHHQLQATQPQIKSKDRCIAEAFSVNFLIELTYLYVNVVRILLLHLLEKACCVLGLARCHYLSGSHERCLQ
jgi:hypothetical protein